MLGLFFFEDGGDGLMAGEWWLTSVVLGCMENS